MKTPFLIKERVWNVQHDVRRVHIRLTEYYWWREIFCNVLMRFKDTKILESNQYQKTWWSTLNHLSRFWIFNRKDWLIPLSPVKTFCKITGNELLYGFIELFKKFSIILINGYFLRNKICELYHLLQARFNHSKGFRKLSLNNLQSFRKANRMDSAALVLVKLLYSRRVQFYYWSCRITGYLGATVF